MKTTELSSLKFPLKNKISISRLLHLCGLSGALFENIGNIPPERNSSGRFESFRFTANYLANESYERLIVAAQYPKKILIYDINGFLARFFALMIAGLTVRE